jgi:transcriptional regulator with XRE-family HTH domain
MLRLLSEAKSRGIPSQNRLAAKAGITPSDLSKIVNRRMVPYPGQLRKLAAAVGWPEDRAEELMQEAGDSQAS